MIAFAYYLLKVSACSGLLFLYYHIALRNKLFHQWNRFYLLATIIVSLVIPTLEFNIWSAKKENQTDTIQLLQVVYSADEYIEEINSNRAYLSAEQWTKIGYSTVSMVMLVLLILGIYRIRSIIRSHSVMLIDDIKFVNTEEKDSPFSFFNYVFWNRQIELNSTSGEHIFKHELVHVREKHSFDKIFLQVILIGFWCNPFFWLIRKELKMIHEFIADQRSVGQSDARAFAAMILQATYPNHYNHLTNQFFQSSIKRRLSMLTKQHNPKISYMRRILALPLFAFVALAFTIKEKHEGQKTTIPLEKEITVVIDAGHGGGTGARAEGFTEDELVLQLAKTIRSSNNNGKIKILLTRENEQTVDLKDRVEFAEKNNADLFISLHMNAAPPLSSNSTNSSPQERNNGYEIGVSNKNTFNQQKSESLGAALIKEIGKSYKTFPALVKRKVGIWVLDKNVYPSVLIECGYITDKQDREFISKKENQELIAQKIIRAIELYASQNATGKVSSKNNFIERVPDTPKAVRITLNTETLEDTVDENFLIILDGVEKGRAKNIKLQKLVKPEDIEKMEVYKGEEATKKFGEKGKQGVFVITTKKPNQNSGLNVNSANIVNIHSTNQTKNQNRNEPVKIAIGKPLTDKNNTDSALLIIDGVEKGTINDLPKFLKNEQIVSVSVYKGIEAIKKYGEKGANGVVDITTTEKPAKENDSK